MVFCLYQLRYDGIAHQHTLWGEGNSVTLIYHQSHINVWSNIPIQQGFVYALGEPEPQHNPLFITSADAVINKIKFLVVIEASAMM